jgi:hypothetical protein
VLRVKECWENMFLCAWLGKGERRLLAVRLIEPDTKMLWVWRELGKRRLEVTDEYGEECALLRRCERSRVYKRGCSFEILKYHHGTRATMAYDVETRFLPSKLDSNLE